MGTFRPEIITAPLSAEKLAELAQGHHGTVKVVVDIKRMALAAGGEWHTDCLRLLADTGSHPADCWGAKLDINTHAVVYKSQINKDRPNNRIDEIQDGNIRKTVLEMIDRLLRPSASESR